MKNLLFILLFVPTILFSQEWIRYNHSDIETMLSNDNVQFDVETLTDGNRTITFNVNDEYILSLVTSKQSPHLCYMEVYAPLNDRSLNALVGWFNRNAVRLSNTEWQIYHQGDISEVLLIGKYEIPVITVRYLTSYTR